MPGDHRLLFMVSLAAMLQQYVAKVETVITYEDNVSGYMVCGRACANLPDGRQISVAFAVDPNRNKVENFAGLLAGLLTEQMEELNGPD